MEIGSINSVSTSVIKLKLGLKNVRRAELVCESENKVYTAVNGVFNFENDLLSPGKTYVIKLDGVEYASFNTETVGSIMCSDIDFESGTVYVDGVALLEPYIHNETTNEEGTLFPLTVAENCIFVLGDNRAVSLDSRSPQIGQIDRREVLGKALCLMIPGTHHGQLPPDYSRVGAIN